MYQYLISSIVFIFVAGYLFWLVIKSPVNLRNYLKWKHVRIESSRSFSEIEEKIRKLYSKKFCVIAGMTNEVIFFREKPTLFSWGNTYVIKPGGDNRHIMLYYSGSMLIWRVDRANLANTIFLLGGRSEIVK